MFASYCDETLIPGPDFMNNSIELLKDNERVLVWYRELKQWRIGCLNTRNGLRYWVFDPKIFHGVDPEKFPGWIPLPPAPE